MKKKKVAADIAKSYNPVKKVAGAIKKAGAKLAHHKPKVAKMPKVMKASAKVKKVKPVKLPKPPKLY